MDKIKSRTQNDIGEEIKRHIAVERKKDLEMVEGYKSTLNRRQRITRKRKNKIQKNSRKRNR